MSLKEVLVVDDNADIRETVAAMLAGLDCAVTTLSNPIEALSLCGHKRFDVVLTDLNMMSEMSGTDLARRLCEELPPEGRPRKIILMTSDDMRGRENETRDFISAILQKPFRLKELEERVTASSV